MILNPAGSIVQPEQLTIEDFSFEVVAERLANLFRWGGAGLSVAQHTLLVRQVAPLPLKKAAMLHDLSEMFIGEIPDPIKQLSPAILDLEERIQKKIFKIFDVPWTAMLEVHFFDKMVGNSEGYHLYPDKAPWKDRGRYKSGLILDKIEKTHLKQIFVSAMYEEFTS